MNEQSTKAARPQWFRMAPCDSARHFEDCGGQPLRDEKGLAEIEAVLSGMGFEPLVLDGVLSFRLPVPGGCVFADPRAQGWTEFAVYECGEGSFRLVSRQYVSDRNIRRARQWKLLGVER